MQWNPPNRKRRRTTSEDEQQQREHTPENQMSYKEVEQKRKDRQRRGWVWIGLGVCAAIAFSGFRIIRPNRLGLVEIFGKYTRTAEPGLRWIPPRPIGRMLKVPMDVQHIEIPGQQVCVFGLFWTDRLTDIIATLLLCILSSIFCVCSLPVSFYICSHFLALRLSQANN